MVNIGRRCSYPYTKSALRMVKRPQQSPAVTGPALLCSLWKVKIGVKKSVQMRAGEHWEGADSKGKSK